MTDLDLAEGVLEALASRLPAPLPAPSRAGFTGGLLGGRALDLYRGFVDSVGGRSIVAPTIMARPLVELAILLRWIRDDPEPRSEMWIAHSEEMDAKAIRQLGVNLPRPPGDPFGTEAVQPSLEAKDARAAAARSAAGRETAPRLLPGLVEMIDAVVKLDEVEGLALRQAYDLAFRSVSPATHSDAASFKSSLQDQADGSIAFVETSSAPVEVLRFLAAGCMAHAIESAAKLCADAEIAGAALGIRLRLAEPE